MNPGPHGPEPSRWRVLQYPGGSSSVRAYLIAVCFVSFQVLQEPPGSGILCPGCAPAKVQIQPAPFDPVRQKVRQDVALPSWLNPWCDSGNRSSKAFDARFEDWQD